MWYHILLSDTYCVSKPLWTDCKLKISDRDDFIWFWSGKDEVNPISMALIKLCLSIFLSPGFILQTLLLQGFGTWAPVILHSPLLSGFFSLLTGVSRSFRSSFNSSTQRRHFKLRMIFRQQTLYLAGLNADFNFKMRYILWVVALLEAYDVTNNSRHLEFYQESEIELKPREISGNFLCFTWTITHK